MTTTDVYQGMEGEKNSSRVLRPPGGGSSDIFGTGSEKQSAAQEQKQNAQRSQGGSNIFGGPTHDLDDQPGVKHINRKQQPSSQSAIFGDSPTASDLKKRNQEGEEFPVYDRSVYMAQMAPQRRNIQQVSTYNPITNESYAGFENGNQKEASPVKRRGQNVNEVSSFNVITNQYSDEGYAEPSPIKPGKRSLSNSNDEGTYNPITGQAIGGKGDDVQKNSSRVLNPPGGKSTGLW